MHLLRELPEPPREKDEGAFMNYLDEATDIISKTDLEEQAQESESKEDSENTSGNG